MKRAIAVLTSTPLLLGACSLVMTQGPPAGHEKMITPFSCTESMTGPILDVLGGVVGLALPMRFDETAGASNNGFVGGVVWGGVTLASAMVGIDRVTQCREARRDLMLRREEAAAATAARRDSVDLISIQKVVITGVRNTMSVGEWTQLVATAYDSSGAAIVDKRFTWSSSNDLIAPIAPDGILEAEGVGTVMITAYTGSAIGTVDVVVVPAR